MPNPLGIGGFKKGTSGNPGGPKKGDLPPIDVKKLARAHTREALAALVEITNDRKQKAGDRILAANSLLDRGFGRPHQSIDIEATLNKRLTELSLEEARRLDQMSTAAAPPMLIDATAEPVEEAPGDGN
jgi:Family of unknown function (DUF5681)